MAASSSDADTDVCAFGRGPCEWEPRGWSIAGFWDEWGFACSSASAGDEFSDFAYGFLFAPRRSSVYDALCLVDVPVTKNAWTI